MSKYVKKEYMEMEEQLYLEPEKVAEVALFYATQLIFRFLLFAHNFTLLRQNKFKLLGIVYS